VKILSVGKQEAAEQWAHLPSTLLHGDAKIANFAILDEGKVAAFDWALAGKGPAAVDLGWYIAINATRLTASKQEFLEGYRQALEQELVVSLDGKQWQEIVTASILIGARMFLWSKAAALDSDTPAARREWKWWVSRLEEIC
jgi:aminoglycoside phosphotransferase (APT) family kinase protein